MRWLTLAIAVIAAGCGSDANPTGPTRTPSLTLSGPWLGRIELRIDGEPYLRQITSATVTHTDTAVTMNFSVGSDVHGEITGTVNGDAAPAPLAGTLQFDMPSDQPPTRCISTATITGTATNNTITWTAATLSEGNCEGAISDMRATMWR